VAVAAGIAYPASAASSGYLQSNGENDVSYYTNAHPYVDDPAKQIVRQIPQLKDLQPAQSQQELPEILRKAGEQVDEFFRHVTDLTAREDISLTRLKQDKPYTHPELAGERVRDSYLILRHSDRNHSDIEEYRTDARGDNFDHTMVKKGFLVTSGFALICNYFSTAFQPESRFRYLGDQPIGGRDAYVVGFAQQPAKATLSIQARNKAGHPVHLLVQGIAWIDKTNFQIVRMRTDLLAPRSDMGLSQETTEVTLSRVQLVDLAAPLWLPSSVKVYVEFSTHNGDVDEFFAESYRNEHRYSDYQRYRVAARVVPLN
jgi:hypothetical protein